MSSIPHLAAPPLVCLVVAMRVEAAPLVERLQLEPYAALPSGPHRVYVNESAALVTSGLGKVASASAVGYLAGLLETPRPTAWLNVGIAGQRDLDIGTPVLAHRVIEQASGKSSYPAQVSPLAKAVQEGAGVQSPGTLEVRTVDEVEREYATPALYEMEAAGFMSAASRLSSAQLVHVLKIVSDNSKAPPDQLDRSRIGDIVSSCTDSVAGVVEALATRAAALRPLR